MKLGSTTRLLAECTGSAGRYASLWWRMTWVQGFCRKWSRLVMTVAVALVIGAWWEPTHVSAQQTTTTPPTGEPPAAEAPTAEPPEETPAADDGPTTPAAPEPATPMDPRPTPELRPESELRPEPEPESEPRPTAEPSEREAAPAPREAGEAGAETPSVVDDGPAAGLPRMPTFSGRERVERFEIGINFVVRLDLRYTEAGFANRIPDYGQASFIVRSRLLLDFSFDLGPGIDAGFTLGLSGATARAETAYDNNFTPAPVFVRHAWGRVEIGDSGLVTLLVGQFPFPARHLVRTDMMWDEDIGLTGAHLIFTAHEKHEKNRLTEAVYFNLFGLMISLDPSDPLGPPNNVQPETVFALAGGPHFRIQRLRIGATFWAIFHARSLYLNMAEAAARVQAVEVHVAGDLDLFQVYAQFLYNFGAARQKLGVIGGVSIGRDTTNGGAQFDLSYFYVERLAWPDTLGDSDATSLGMPGTSGVKWALSGMVAEGIVLRTKMHISWLLGDNFANRTDADVYFNWMLDLEIRF